MQFVIVGIFVGYGEAEAVVQDLEVAGIRGGQVEVISDIDEDSRTANTPGEPSTKDDGAHHGWLARLFGPGGPFANREVRDLSGEQPNYIGEQEFYANHIKQGGAIIVVRTPAEPAANRAAEILHAHGARTPGHKDGPAIQRID
jgi:hypothetical protein